jgi:hypothetical protein
LQLPISNTKYIMNAKIDLKSALCGLVVGILAMLAIGASEAPNAIGKYQVASGAGFVTIVDTTTGQAWGANLASPPPGFQTIQPGFWDKK